MCGITRLLSPVWKLLLPHDKVYGLKINDCKKVFTFKAARFYLRFDLLRRLGDKF